MYSIDGRNNPLKTEGIFRKFKKKIYLTQKWKDLKNNGTWKLVSIPFKRVLES
jgi:hypothetical protein